MLQEIKALGVRTYIPEKKKTGKRHWVGKEDQQQVVYANRQRLQRPKGKQLLRKRGELVERTFAHCHETGGMRRTYLRKHGNILKRLLIHVTGASLGCSNSSSQTSSARAKRTAISALSRRRLFS